MAFCHNFACFQEKSDTNARPLCARQQQLGLLPGRAMHKKKPPIRRWRMPALWAEWLHGGYTFYI